MVIFAPMDTIRPLIKPVRKADELNSQRIDVTVFTLKAQFEGHIMCQPHQRMLDVLNSAANRNNLLGNDFLEIRDVEIREHNSARPVRYLKVGYARRSNIVIVGERKCIDSCRPELPYAMRQKKPIPAEVELSSMSLKGSLHAEIWQDLTGALNRDERFLPMTDVSLNASPVDEQGKFEFAAVNRDHIIFVGQA
jgi:hypothetical protein